MSHNILSLISSIVRAHVFVYRHMLIYCSSHFITCLIQTGPHAWVVQLFLTLLVFFLCLYDLSPNRHTLTYDIVKIIFMALLAIILGLSPIMACLAEALRPLYLMLFINQHVWNDYIASYYGAAQPCDGSAQSRSAREPNVPARERERTPAPNIPVYSVPYTYGAQTVPRVPEIRNSLGSRRQVTRVGVIHRQRSFSREISPAFSIFGRKAPDLQNNGTGTPRRSPGVKSERPQSPVIGALGSDDDQRRGTQSKRGRAKK